MKRHLKAAAIITVIMFFIALVGEVLIATVFPQYTFKGHLAVPLYFWLFYIISAFFIHQPMRAADYVKFLIGFKAVKMFVSMVFITALAFFMREHVVAILLNFIIYYLLLLVPECTYCIYLKKYIKRRVK